MTTHTATVEISHLAGLGDGVTAIDGRTLFVPYVCAGEQVEVALPTPLKDGAHAELMRVISPAAARAKPACEHFTTCGGCRLQHLDEESYHAFKLAQLHAALKPLGEDLPIQPLWSAGAQSRRRAELAVQIAKGQVRLGFHQPRSHTVVDLAQCPVLTPALEALLPGLRTAIAALKKPSAVASVQLAEVANGVDMAFTLTAALTATDKTHLQAWARANAVVRLVLRHTSGEVEMLVNGAALARMDGVEVELPIGTFLQASEAAQNYMITRVKEALAGARHVVDIYSGVGTFSLPLLASGATISAYEGEASMVGALHNAARALGRAGQVNAEARDLFRVPLKAANLAQADAAIINPPRNGAEPQVKELAQTGMKTVAMVSCNPISFARDAKHLLRSGFSLEAIYPVDQFVWSAHLELVTIFSKY